MDVRCPQCHTLYELDQEQVGARSVTLKCSQCQHVFRFGGKADEVGENHRRWMVRRKEQGDILYLNTFDTLHEWVMKRTVNDRDEISRTGKRWTRLRDIGEFQPIFAVLESIARLTGDLDASDVSSILTPRADTPLTMGVAPRHPDKRGRMRTQMQFGEQREAHKPMRTEDVTKKVRPSPPELDSDTSSDFEARFKQHKAEDRGEPTKRARPSPARTPVPSPAPVEELSDTFVLGSPDMSQERVFTPQAQRSSGAGVWIVAAAVVIAGGAGAFYLNQEGYFAPKPDVVVIGETNQNQPQPDPKPQPIELMRGATVAALEAAHRENDAIWTLRYENASQPFYIALDTAYAAADQASVGVELDQQLKDARSALEHGKADLASRLYQQVLAESPNNAAALNGIGWAMLERGRPEEAVAQFKKTINTDAGYGDAYIGLGSAQRQLGRLQEAHHAYDLYLGRFPTGPKASIAAYQMKELKKQLGL